MDAHTREAAEPAPAEDADRGRSDSPRARRGCAPELPPAQGTAGGRAGGVPGCGDGPLLRSLPGVMTNRCTETLGLSCDSSADRDEGDHLDLGAWALRGQVGAHDRWLTRAGRESTVPGACALCASLGLLGCQGPCRGRCRHRFQGPASRGRGGHGRTRVDRRALTGCPGLRLAQFTLKKTTNLEWHRCPSRSKRRR